MTFLARPVHFFSGQPLFHAVLSFPSVPVFSGDREHLMLQLTP
jgi:hypothetical protein